MKHLLLLLPFYLLLTACQTAAPTPVNMATPVIETVVVAVEVTAPPKEVVATVLVSPTPTLTPTATPEPPRSASANHGSGNPSMSADGRFIVFESRASNLATNDQNYICDYEGEDTFNDSCADIFVYDRESDEVSLLSVAYDGSSADGESYLPYITPDAHYVVFTSTATNLVAESPVVCFKYEEAGRCTNVYLYDLHTRDVTLISRGLDGAFGNDNSGDATISDDGRYIAFISVATNLVENDIQECDYDGDSKAEYNCEDIFIYDRETDETVKVTRTRAGDDANNGSNQAMISGDGNFVTFLSYATNLADDDSSTISDIYLWERTTREVTRVSHARDGGEPNSYSFDPEISRDGAFIAYQSFANNIVSRDNNRRCDNDGDLGYSEPCPDIFVYEQATGQTTRVSVQSSGAQILGASQMPALSPDGRFVLFINDAAVMLKEQGRDYDLFLYDRQMEVLSPLSITAAGVKGDANSGEGLRAQIPRPNYDISEDGRWVVFGSAASNFVERDSNNNCGPDAEAPVNCMDIFLLDRDTGEITLVSKTNPRANDPDFN